MRERFGGERGRIGVLVGVQDVLRLHDVNWCGSEGE